MTLRGGTPASCGVSLKSVGNFFKGMFCDEKDFSLKRTATTIGTVAVLAGAAPLAVALGAKVIGTAIAGYMAVDGGTKVIKGTSKYMIQKHMKKLSRQ